MNKTSRPKTGHILHPFDYKGVTLLPSHWQEQFAQTLDYFLSLPDDDILKGFRERAGLPAPGLHLGGWYSGDERGDWYSAGDTFHTFGQWLGALARMSCAAQHPELRAKTLVLVEEWSKTIAPDGYFFFSSHPNSPHYAYEKMCGGLVDVAEFLQEPSALEHLARITDWAVHHLDRTRSPATLNDFAGGGPLQQTEWYTLSENLYRAFQLTRESIYSDFARVWHYTSFWNPVALGQDAFIGKHAYSHVNTLCSAAMAFVATRDPHYLQVIEKGYETLNDHHLYATGCYGPSERFMPEDGSMGQSLEPWSRFRALVETPCGSWAGFKLGRYLITLTGKAAYGDWIERLVYNGTGAALPLRGRGQTFYYADYGFVNANKTYYQTAWPCCSGTMPLAVADYHDLIYFKSPNGIVVNLFIPSTLTWNQAGIPTRLVQRTAFPKEGSSHFTIETPVPLEFTLDFRSPGWLAGSLSATVNGEPVQLEVSDEGWVGVTRRWESGDYIDIHLPMDLHLAPVDRQHPHRVALMYGPIVLAADEWSQPGALLDQLALVESTDAPLTYRTLQTKPVVTFRPYYEIGPGVPHRIYFDLASSSHVPRLLR